MNPISSLLRLLSGGYARSRLPILTYHRVLAKADPMMPWDPHGATFRSQMKLLRDCCAPCTLTRATKLLQNSELPPNSVCVTFDDGYLDNHDVALPILAELGIPATFFIATDFLCGEIMWNDLVISAVRSLAQGTHEFEAIGRIEIRDDASKPDIALRVLRRIRYEPAERRRQIALAMVHHAGIKDQIDKRMMMTDEMIRSLRDAGMEIGAHTKSHPILSSLSDKDARSEIVGSKIYLESLLDREITTFAYPNGRFGVDETERDADLVKRAGFSAAVTTDWGTASAESYRYALPRLGFSGASRTRLMLQFAKAFRSPDPNIQNGALSGFDRIKDRA